jgi:hypothetical protein
MSTADLSCLGTLQLIGFSYLVDIYWLSSFVCPASLAAMSLCDNILPFLQSLVNFRVPLPDDFDQYGSSSPDGSEGSICILIFSLSVILSLLKFHFFSFVLIFSGVLV